VITPPDVFSLILVSIPLVLLYEVSIFIAGRVARKREIDSEAADSATGSAEKNQ
jgi:sec-independent protein translocase protein TatC